MLHSVTKPDDYGFIPLAPIFCMQFCPFKQMTNHSHPDNPYHHVSEKLIGVRHCRIPDDLTNPQMQGTPLQLIPSSSENLFLGLKLEQNVDSIRLSMIDK